MKKMVIVGIFVSIVLLTAVGCVSKKEVVNEIKKGNDTSLVLYFSATGTTKKIAERIASKSGSDIIEIIPKEKYTSKDLDYNEDCRANREQNDDKARPEIENKMDIDKYQTIYLGYPIWWGTNPKIILTLLDTYDFSDKMIIPFCTSGSSGIEESVNSLRKYNSKLNIKDGKRFAASDDDKVIEEFLNNN